MIRTVPLKRTGIRRSRGRRKPASPATRCDWSVRAVSGRTYRCTKRGYITVDENERYCKGHATERADKLVGDYVKARDGHQCQLRDFNGLPCLGVLSACHLIPKGQYGATRFLPANIVAGCAGHHIAFDNRIIEKEAWIRRRLGSDVYDALKLVAVGGAKYDPASVIRLFREPA